MSCLLYKFRTESKGEGYSYPREKHLLSRKFLLRVSFNMSRANEDVLKLKFFEN